jgi:hypothetical protein
MIFAATHTPSYDRFKTVTLMVSVRLPDLTGAVNVTEDVSVEEARRFAQQINAACDIVERDQG